MTLSSNKLKNYSLQFACSFHRLIDEMSVEQNEIMPERQTRSAARENPGNIQALYHEYLLRGDLKTSVEKVYKEIKPIVTSLKEALADR